MRSVLLAVMVFLSVGFVPAFAGGESEDAERYRLQAEMDRLARRNVWKGVERTYAELLDLGGLTTSDHMLGAQASQSRGEMLQAMERFEAAVQVGIAALPEGGVAPPDGSLAEAKRTLEVFVSRYGKVDISVDKSRISMLVRIDGMPFSAQERESIVYARDLVVKKRVFQGLLPIGIYMIDGERFEIAASPDWHMIRVSPHK